MEDAVEEGDWRQGSLEWDKVALGRWRWGLSPKVFSRSSWQALKTVANTH